jgi:hypothetical protein
MMHVHLEWNYSRNSAVSYLCLSARLLQGFNSAGAGSSVAVRGCLWEGPGRLFWKSMCQVCFTFECACLVFIKRRLQTQWTLDTRRILGQPSVAAADKQIWRRTCQSTLPSRDAGTRETKTQLSSLLNYLIELYLLSTCNSRGVCPFIRMFHHRNCW